MAEEAAAAAAFVFFLPNCVAGEEFITILPHRYPGLWPPQLSITVEKQIKMTADVPDFSGLNICYE